MNKIQSFLVVTAIALFCTPTFANDLGYATDTNDNLWQVDFTTGTSSLIGNTQVFLEAIALRGDGTLFGTDTSGQLYTINTTNAATTFIGGSALGNVEALDFNGADLLCVNFVNDVPPSVYSLNQTNAVPTLVATSDVVTGFVRSGALLDPNNILIRGDSGGNTLFRMALAGGATTTVGAMGATIYGMDFVGSTLYGVSENGLLFNINPVTGLATQIGDTGDQFYLSLTTNSIPEPSTFALLTVCATLLAGRRRESYKLEIAN
jgi:hypothetical protein